MRFLIILALIVFESCYRVPITNRLQFRALPDQFMLSLSIIAYNEFIAKNPPLPEHHPDAARVKQIGSRMSKIVNHFLASKGYKKVRKRFQWSFEVVDDPTVNAWCLPGGKIVFYKGILPICENDAGIATVIGHEMAHAIAQHGNERLTQQLMLHLGLTSLSIALKDKPEETKQIFLSVFGIGGALGILAYSRKHEYEADKIGMVLMALAGYDPSEAIAFWERMQKNSKGNWIPEFLRTHPSDANRIKAMKEFLPKAKRYYKPS